MSQVDNVWRQQRLSLSTKLRIYSSLVQSVVLCCSATWTLRKVDNDRIQNQSFHMQALRRILDIFWYDNTSNAAVRERTKLPDQLSLIADSWSRLSSRPKNTPASQALQLSKCSQWHSSWCRLETTSGSSKENVAATSLRGLWDICWSRPRSHVVEIATTFRWSNAAVSEWVSLIMLSTTSLR